jgi:flagellin
MPKGTLSGTTNNSQEFTEEFIMGAFSILNNIGALYAQNQLCVSNAHLTKSITRLSSGKRINSGADDAAGLMIADRLRANVSALDQSVRNANDCISVGQIADSALQEITNNLTRAVSLAEEAATGTVDSTGRAALNAEFTQIQAEIARIAVQTNFSGVGIFQPINGSLSAFVGDIYSPSSIAVTIHAIGVGTDANGNQTVTSLGDPNSNPVDLSTVDLTTQGNAATALGTIRDALTAVAKERAAIGADANRLQSAVAIMQSQSLNTQNAESTIRDANMATEISNVTKYEILNQTGIAALSQANAQSQTILTLLRVLG